MRHWDFKPDNISSSIQVTFKVDYVRVYQPQNRYVDMEPVYQ